MTSRGFDGVPLGVDIGEDASAAAVLVCVKATGNCG